MPMRKVWNLVGWNAIPFAALRIGARNLFPCDRDEVKAIREQRDQRARKNLVCGLVRKMGTPDRLFCGVASRDGQECPSYGQRNQRGQRVQRSREFCWSPEVRKISRKGAEAQSLEISRLESNPLCGLAPWRERSLPVRSG